MAVIVLAIYFVSIFLFFVAPLIILIIIKDKYEDKPKYKPVDDNTPGYYLNGRVDEVIRIDKNGNRYVKRLCWGKDGYFPEEGPISPEEHTRYLIDMEDYSYLSFGWNYEELGEKPITKEEYDTYGITWQEHWPLPQESILLPKKVKN